jgi:hypothetical protein
VRGSEGHAVIAPDVGGQAALLEKPFKCGKSVVFPSGRKRFTGEQKTAGVIGDRQRIAILPISQQELSLVVGAPELVGALPRRERSSLRAPPGTTTALHKAVAIEQGMDGTVGRNFNPRKSANQTLTNLSSTPGGVLVLQVQDVVLYLERQLVCVVMGPPASICEALNAAFLIAVEDLVTCKVPPSPRRLAGEPQTAFFHPSPNTPSKA